ncbi:MAG: DUF6600 domain-containing protein [Candidatus Acidiferrales bacterium]
MKRFLVSFAMILLVLGVSDLRAQDQTDSEAQAQQQDPQSQPPLPQSQQQTQQQDPQSQQPAQNQPGAARLSFIHGDVSTQRGDNGQWISGTLNTPIVTGDRVSTGQKSRAELQLDYANILRMSDNATATVANLTRTNIQVQVGQGLTEYSALKGSEANAEIDTPNAAIRPAGQGDYRILVNSNAETQVIVRNGSAEVSTPQGTTHVEKGQMITVAGTDNPEYKTDPAPGKDGWDAWNNDRNRMITSAESWRHTDRYYTGSEDLDSYGTWSEVPDYGQVWTPRTDPGWAPYRDGRWVWEPYYGWTWVSYEPWGWAPYHYGRWFVYGGNWAWWPGPVAEYPGYYPIWAPAYVSFFGFGGGGWGFGIGFGFGGGWGRIGWLPCGPGDWFHPWYGRWGGRYSVTNINNVNNFHNGFAPLGRGGRGFSNINQAFGNGRVRGGFSSMAGNQFGRGAVAAHQQPISSAAFRQANLMTGRMPVTPSRASYSPTNRAASASTIRTGTPGSQRFFSTSRVANNAVRGQSRFSGNRNGGSSERPTSGMTASRGSTLGSSQADARTGWHSFTSPQSGNVNRSGFVNRNTAGNESAHGSISSPGRSASGNQGGWNHFTPSSRESQSQSSGRGFVSPGASEREFTPSRSASRGGYEGSTNRSYSRPPLNMRQPIVTPRGGSSYGYGSPRDSYSAPRGGYSPPRGGYSAPRGGGSYRGGGGYRGGAGGHGGGGGHSGGHGR